MLNYWCQLLCRLMDSCDNVHWQRFWERVATSTTPADW